MGGGCENRPRPAPPALGAGATADRDLPFALAWRKALNVDLTGPRFVGMIRDPPPIWRKCGIVHSGIRSQIEVGLRIAGQWQHPNLRFCTFIRLLGQEKAPITRPTCQRGGCSQPNRRTD